MPAAEFDFKLGQEGYKGLGNLTDDLTLTIIDSKGLRNLEERAFHLVIHIPSIVLDIKAFAA